MGTYGYVDQGDARSVVRVRLEFVDECVLAPVADHEAQPEEHERDDEGEGRSTRVYVRRHEVQEKVSSVFRDCGLQGELVVLLACKVEGQVKPDEEQEPSNVVEEMPDVVSLVSKGGRKIVRAIAFDVMVLHVVVIVRIPSVAHQRFQDVREAEVEHGPVFRQHAVVVDVVVHQESE